MTEEKRFFLTKEGLEKRKKKHKKLKELKLSMTGGGAPGILHSEDINPEYLTFQEDLNFLEFRIAELGNILKKAELIKAPPKGKQNVVDLGAKILAEVDGQNNEFTLVGFLEANPSLGKISNESPVGKMLLGCKVGEEVIISSPIKTTYKIKKIEYNVA